MKFRCSRRKACVSPPTRTGDVVQQEFVGSSSTRGGALSVARRGCQRWRFVRVRLLRAVAQNRALRRCAGLVRTADPARSLADFGTETPRNVHALFHFLPPRMTDLASRLRGEGGAQMVLLDKAPDGRSERVYYIYTYIRTYLVASSYTAECVCVSFHCGSAGLAAPASTPAPLL